MDIINEQNCWILCCCSNRKNFYILHVKKKAYFRVVEGGPPSHFYHPPHLLVSEAPVGMFYLGEYRPVCEDAALFCKLPIMNNNIIVNTRTNIAYYYTLKDNNHFLEEKGEGCGDNNNNVNLQECKFAGPYHPHLNADSYIEDRPLLRALNYNFGPSYNMTFIIPFLHNHTTNVQSLARTIASIETNVSEPCVVAVVVASLDTTLNMVCGIKNNKNNNKKMVVYAVEHHGYVGHLGFENRLNVMMKNNSDRASFYNALLLTYGSGTKRCAIWEYNWVLEADVPPARGLFKAPLWWSFSAEKEGPIMGTHAVGAILHAATDKYGTTSNGQDVTSGTGLPWLSLSLVAVKAFYDEYDMEEWRHRYLYGPQVGVKKYFENLKTEASNEEGGESKQHAAPDSVYERGERGPIFKESVVGALIGTVNNHAQEKGVPQWYGTGGVENEKVQAEYEDEIGHDSTHQVELQRFFLNI